MEPIIKKIKTFCFEKKEESEESKENEISRWQKVQSISISFFKYTLSFLFAVLIGHTIYELFRYDIVIKPFETPFNLGRQEGYTGAVVAYRLQYNMDEIRKELKTNSIRRDKGVAAIQFTELEKRQEVDISTMGLSLNAIVAQFRRMLGIRQRLVSGDIVIRHGKLYLTLRITGQPSVTFSGTDEKNPESVIRKAAKHVIESFEPLSVGLNYCLNDKNKALKKLIDFSQQLPSSKKKVGEVVMLEGCLLKNQGKYKQALAKLAQAEKIDRKNPVIYLIRGNTLQSNTKYEQAIDAYKTATKYAPENGAIYIQWARTLIKSAKLKNDDVLKKDLLEKAFAKYQFALEKEPKNNKLYTDWGYNLAYAHQYFETAFETADKKFERAITINPNYAPTYAMWGDVLLKLRNQPEEASDKFEKAVALNPGVDAWIYGNWGVALVRQERYQEAIIQFQKATALKPLDWVHKEWGNTLFLMQEYDKAITQFEIAMELTPNDWYPYYVLGKTFTEQERYEEAITQYQKALEINPTFAGIYNRWGYALLRLNKAEETLTQCETVLNLQEADNKDKANANALCGLALIALNQHKKAIKRCQTALALNKTGEWTPLCLEKALAKFNKAEDFAEYESFVESLTDDQLKGRYYYAYGVALVRLKQDKKAILQYKKAGKLNLDDAPFYGELGNALLRVGNPKEAMTQYKKAAEQNPNINWIYGGWGIALAKLKRYDEAIMKFKKALVLKQGTSWIYSQLGEALVKLHQYEEAITQYQTALKLNPEPTLYYEFGKLRAKLKQYKQAINQYENAVALSPNNRRYYYVWGKALAMLGEYKQAISRYQSGLEIEPDHIWSRVMLGYALIRFQKPDKASTEAQTVLKSTKASKNAKAAAHALCGLAENLRKRPKVAIEKCQTALKIYKNEDWAYLCLGEAKIQLNKPSEAVKQFESAVKVRTEIPLYYYKLGEALAQLEQKEDAITQYQKAIEFDKGGKIAKQAQIHIKALKAKSPE
jgi:tetratricopeptide (TPR) repeat protein